MTMFIRIKDYIFAVDQIQYITLASKNIIVMLKDGYMSEVRFHSELCAENEYSSINDQLRCIGRATLGETLNSGKEK